MGKKVPLEERLDKYIERIPESGCWIWIGSGVRYGKIKIDGKYISLHRLMYERKNGKTDQLVLHKCNVQACCNPDHLYAGSNSDNQFDRGINKGYGIRDEETGRFLPSAG